MSEDRAPTLPGGSGSRGGMGGAGGRRNGLPGGRGGMGGRMSAPGEKAKDFSATLRRLLRYLAPHRFKLIAVFILAIGSTVFSIVGPKIMGRATTKLAEGLVARIIHYVKLQYAILSRLPQSAIDSVRNEVLPLFDLPGIGRILTMMLVLYGVSALLSFISGLIMSDVAQGTVFDMRRDVKVKLDKLPLRYYDSRTHGEILSRVTNDMDTIANTLQQSLTQLITSVTSIVGILIMMLSIDLVMTLIALVTLPLSFVFTIIVAKNSQKYFKEQQQTIGDLNGHVEEMFAGHKAVKAFGHEGESIADFDEINDQYFEVGWKAQFISGLIMPALNFVSNMGYVLVCVVGSVLVSKNTIEVGDVQAFIQYMRTFTMPIVQTANIANVIQSTIAAAERVFEVLDEEEERPDSVMGERPDSVMGERPDHDLVERSDSVSVEYTDSSYLELPEYAAGQAAHQATGQSSQQIVGQVAGQVAGRLELRHVVFGYSPDEILMHDINISVNPGETIAIVGPTGAGKTTLVNLLMRFYEIDGGDIIIDGVNTRDMRRSDLRRMFGMVLQDTWLFNGTIYDNIRYGNDKSSEADVFKAAQLAYADHFIRALPEGYATVLNEEASNISQGQKQLLTIARAILADPPILILDEATSNVDTRTEILIQAAMDRLMAGRTSFVIAHRLSTIRNANNILVMNHGDIIEQGSQEELMAAGGFYADLYNSQFAED